MGIGFVDFQGLWEGWELSLPPTVISTASSCRHQDSCGDLDCRIRPVLLELDWSGAVQR